MCACCSVVVYVGEKSEKNGVRVELLLYLSAVIINSMRTSGVDSWTWHSILHCTPSFGGYVAPSGTKCRASILNDVSINAECTYERITPLSSSPGCVVDVAVSDWLLRRRCPRYGTRQRDRDRGGNTDCGRKLRMDLSKW